MKLNIKRCLIVFLSFVFAFLLALKDLNAVCYAYNDSTCLEIEKGFSFKNYSFAPLEQKEFIIKDSTGTLYNNDYSFVVEFENQSIILPDFDIYKIIDYKIDFTYYQADVLNFKDNTNILYECIYENESYEYVLNIHYLLKSDKTVYNIVTKLNNEFVEFFDSISIIPEDNDVLVRLRDSTNQISVASYPFDNYDLSYSYLNFTEESELNYELLTSNDGIIHDYVDNYLGQYRLEDGHTITDDPIVNIVPKELCFILGHHLFIGKEYGFYIYVTPETQNTGYVIDIMIIDVINIIPELPLVNTGTTKIQPLFQFKYRGADRESSAWSPFDPNLDKVVYLNNVHYTEVEYYIKDAAIKVSLDSPTLLNCGDIGYDASSDDGAFMIQTRVNARGVGIKRYRGSFIEDTAKCVLGFIPYVGTVYSIYDYVSGVYDGFANGGYLDEREVFVTDNEANINTYISNGTDQILEYGNLIKSQAVTLIPDAQKPRLIDVNHGYFEVKYVVNRRDGSTYNKLRVINSISLSIVKDETSIISQRINLCISNVSTSEASNYYRLEDWSSSNNEEQNVIKEYNNNVIKFVPGITGKYTIKTQSDAGEPSIYVSNASNSGQIFTDEIYNLNSSINKKITMDFFKNNVYYIVASRIGTNYDYGLTIDYDISTFENMNINSRKNVNISNNSLKLYKFVAPFSDYFDIYTISSSGNPELSLLSNTGLLLAFDDNSAGNNDALIRCNLTRNNTYYIVLNGVNGSNFNSMFNIIPSISGRNTIQVNQSMPCILSEPLTFEFSCTTTSNYKIFSQSLPFGASNDPYIEIYNANREKIAFDNNSGSGNNAQIIIRFYQGENYYIHVKDLSSTSDPICNLKIIVS